MKTTALLACAAAVSAGKTWSSVESTTPENYTFQDFTEEFSRTFDTLEESHARKAIFQANLETILQHNADKSQTYTMGINDYADMTKAEFKAFYAGRNSGMAGLKEMGGADLSGHQEVSALPASVDWRTHSPAVVTPVKNQGGCGSCWAFSTAETLESHIALATGKLMEFSPQEFVDCAPNPDECGGTGGCQGSVQWLGFKYAMTAGILTEASYPYKARTNKCGTAGIASVATIKDFVRLPQNNYTSLMNAIVNVGPIAVSGAAEPWQLYSRGVFSKNCGTDVDHAIQAVGYGTDATHGDYWLIRNSWGASWGEKGYIRIARMGESAAGEPCGTDKTPLDGTGCKGGPATIQVCGVCGIMSDSSYATGGALA